LPVVVWIVVVGFLAVPLAVGEEAMSESRAAAAHLRQLMEDDWQWSLAQYPELATRVGHAEGNDRWTRRSVEAISTRQQHDRSSLAALLAIDRKMLPADEHLNYDFYRHQLELAVSGQQFPEELLPIDQMSGVQTSIASTILLMPTARLADYENILARLAAVPQVVDEAMALLKQGVAAGITVPRVTLRDVPGQIRAVMAVDGPLMRPFEQFPDGIDPATQAALHDRAREVMAEDVIPAYRRLLDYIEEKYIPAARESVGLGQVAGGSAWYAHAVRESTSTDLTADEIHTIGLGEVKRIRAQMDEVIAGTGFSGSFSEFLLFLRTDEQFFYTDAAALLTGYRDISKRADAGLIKMFGLLPRLPYGVEPIPAYAEKSQTTAYYQPGSARAGRPGVYYANTYDLKSRPRWEMEALSLHEAVPGHHLQFALAQELEDVPAVRRHAYLTAFSEGWGLYSESLGTEMGFYTDPYSRFGQLTYEMWRAIRLVVDTGLHAKGWSRQQAIDYFTENAGKSEHDIVVEVDRYIVWPGQALAYKIGELKIKELRAHAEQELGETFDLRAFHDLVLAEGSIPLHLLEARVHSWVAMQTPDGAGS
jgi:uncharacterized protein (DUF885 family)